MPSLNKKEGDGHLAAIDGDVAVTNDLTSFGAGLGKPRW